MRRKRKSKGKGMSIGKRWRELLSNIADRSKKKMMKRKRKSMQL